MINFQSNCKVYLACGYTDMRKSTDALYAIIRYQLKLSPVSNSYFIFCNKDRDKIKIFHWDGSGFWVHYKRQEIGKFRWPLDSTSAKQITHRQLQWIIGDIAGEKSTKTFRKII